MGLSPPDGARPSLPAFVYPDGGAVGYGAPQGRYQAFRLPAAAGQTGRPDTPAPRQGRCSQASTSGAASATARRSYRARS